MRIFIVDDDPDSLDMLGELLRARLPGCNYGLFLRGREALSAALDTWPDVVISDIEMPGMSGYEFAERLLTLHAPERAPLLIAISGNFAAPHRHLTGQAFQHAFSKPVHLHHLVRLIEAHIEEEPSVY